MLPYGYFQFLKQQRNFDYISQTESITKDFWEPKTTKINNKNRILNLPHYNYIRSRKIIKTD